MILRILPIALLAMIVTACSQQKALVSELTEYVVTDTLFVTAPAEVNESSVPQRLPLYRATPARAFDLLHTKLELSFDFKKEYVNGIATLTLAPYFDPVDTLVLDAKNFVLHSVINKANGQGLPYHYDGEKLKIRKSDNAVWKDTSVIVIDYTARPGEGPEGGSDAIRSDRGLFFIDPLNENPGKPLQVWTQGETEHNSRWFPTIDKPNERCTQEIILTIPDSLKSLSNGLLVDSRPLENGMRKDHWSMNQPHAPYLFMLAIGKYAIIEDSWRDIPVQYYVEPKFKDDATSIFDHTKGMLSYFSDILDYPYPWQKYAQVVVRDYVSGAMENTTGVIFGDFVQRESEDLIDNNNDDIVAHEMFHHWFGDLVTCESWSNLTMNEGFANYAEYLWREEKYGYEDAELHRYSELMGYLQEAENRIHDLIHFQYEDKEDMFDRHSYNKGGLILHMLRSYVGDRAFFRALKKYLTDQAYGTGEAHQLRLAFEEITGRDWNWFFNQWFFDKGHPIISYESEYFADSSLVVVLLEQVQNPEKHRAIFRLPLTIDIHYSDGTTARKEIDFNRRSQTFKFNVKKEVVWVNIDPDRNHLIEWLRPQLPPEDYIFADIKHPIDRLFTMSRTLQGNSQNVSNEIRQYLSDPLWLIRYYGLNYLNVNGADGFESTLVKMAQSDANANLRGFAANLLANFPSDASIAACRNIVENDSASVAISSALSTLSVLDTTSIDDYITPWLNSTSPIILSSIGFIYADRARASNADFYPMSIERLTDSDVRALYEPWIQYAMNVDNELRYKIIENWTDIASDEDLGFRTRTQAFKALDMVANELVNNDTGPEVDSEMIEKIRKNQEAILSDVDNDNLESMMLN